MLSNNNGTADLIKTIYPDRPIRNLYPYSMPDNHLLCYFYDTDSTNTNYKTPPRWLYWAMFTPESLNFPVSTKELSLSPFSFYPNPGKSQINIQYSSDYDAINVYSIEGKLLKVVKNQDSTIDVLDLPAGFYFFELQLRGLPVTRVKKFVKIDL